MATGRQITANQANARRSTGPRTRRGKGIASRNNTRHGLYSSSPVILKLESPQDWAQHHQATLTSLAPDGPVEHALAERIALILWRLGRVARYEHTVTTHAQQHAEDDLATEHTDPAQDAQTIRNAYARARSYTRAFARYHRLDDDAPIASAYAKSIIRCVAARIPGFALETFSAPDILDPGQDIESTPGWTVGRVQRLIDAIAAATNTDPRDIVHLADEAVRSYSNATRTDYDRLTSRVTQLRRERIVPQDTRLEHIIRFETHLSRQLTQTLAQLQQLQHRRARDFVDSNPIA